MRPLLELNAVTYAYTLPNGERIPALRGLSLQVEEGEYVALIGANGSGKTTLARHLNALLIPDDGHVTIAGMDTRDAAHHAAIRQTVGMVFQRPEDQIVATTVENDVAFGAENMGVPPAEIRARVKESLDTVGMWEQRLRPPHLLSAGQMQRVVLAGVLAMQSPNRLGGHCIVFDEATAMLDPAGRHAVRAIMARLHREGATIIAITHAMEEALDAERVVVLDHGHIVMDDTPARVFAAAGTLRDLGLDLPPVVQLAETLRSILPALPPSLLSTADLINALLALPYRPPKPSVPQKTAATTPMKLPFITVHALGYTYLRGTPLAHRALQQANLTLAEGTAHGLLGATGSGKSTLLQHLNGLLHPQEGSARVGEFDLGDPHLDARAVRRAVGLAFQLPERQIFEQYVGDEIAYGPRLLDLSRDELRERVRWAMALVGLDFETFKDRYTFSLSGGEKRKVALASILALQPRVLLLDEPTAGLDPGSRRDLLARLHALNQTGITLILSSHQMDTIAALTEQVTVLAEGTTALEGRTGIVFTRAERLHSLGLEAPVVTQVAEALRANGWPLPTGLVSEKELVKYIKDAY
ncbi:MAG: ATP-binding cassette domain-containing protein [Anaerolineae bacterium]|nr:ATP-binding cassette domain-containing protein [Anaerolineae bacterium]